MRNGNIEILIVEDDPAVARSLQDGLKREGYGVVWRQTVETGTDYAFTHQPHVILLDVRLPDGSGFDACRELRRQGLFQPILMLTVRDTELDKVLGLEMGADDYITKPFSLRELLSRIRANTRRVYGELASAGEELLLVGDLAIDTMRAQVRMGDRRVDLTPTEYRILSYMARNAGRVLSREQILAAVWGHETTVDNERAVNVHIRRLREKVEHEPSRPRLILTVPGLGYRLAEPREDGLT